MPAPTKYYRNLDMVTMSIEALKKKMKETYTEYETYNRLVEAIRDLTMLGLLPEELFEVVWKYDGELFEQEDN